VEAEAEAEAEAELLETKTTMMAKPMHLVVLIAVAAKISVPTSTQETVIRRRNARLMFAAVSLADQIVMMMAEEEAQ